MTSTAPHPTGMSTRLSRVTVNATVFLSSASIMVVELAAGRLISRYVGQSLYTWTTIIGVILAGISLGNYLGGRLADRRSCVGTVCGQFLMAALGCLSVLPMNDVAGGWMVLHALSWPMRILCHVSLVFFLPSVILGTISPVIAKRALALTAEPGRAIGAVYAWAAAGSILGTYLTGLYLLSWAGVTAILYGCAGVLGAVGGAYAIAALVHGTGGRACTVTVGQAGSHGAGPRGLALGILVVFLVNAGIMAVEMAAMRIVARHYGQTLYGWTSVIGMILLGLSLGGFLGGALAGRYNPRRTLCVTLTLASAAIVLGPLLGMVYVTRPILFQFTLPEQLTIHALTVYCLPALLVGAVTPLVARLLLGGDEGAGTGSGRAVGLLYASGALGSILGTFATGFWLLGAVGPEMVPCLIAVIPALLALGYCDGARGLRRAALLWGVVSLVVAGGSLAGAAYNGIHGAPTSDAVYTDVSDYQYIAIKKDRANQDYRDIILDKLIHSRVNMANPLDLRYSYEWVYAAFLDRYYPAPKPMSALVIGGGGYVFPRYLELTRPGSRVDVAEIDPAVTRAAIAAFGVPPDTTIRTYSMDARNCLDDALRRGDVKYDCIYGDSINDYTVPYHLTTLEFTQRVSDLLTDDGMYLFNLIDALQHGQFLGAVVNTCQRVFPYVYVYNTAFDSKRRDTFVVVGSKRPIAATSIPADIATRHAYYGGLLDEKKMVDLKARSRGVVLTDDFAPVDIMLAPVVRMSQDGWPRLLLDQSIRRREEGKLAESERLARKIIRCGSFVEQGYEQLGLTLVEKGEPKAALEAFQEALDLGAENAAIRVGRGRAALAMQDLDGAVGEFERALIFEPVSSTIRLHLAAVRRQQHDVDGAIRETDEVLKNYPCHLDALKLRAEIAMEAGRIADARDTLTKTTACGTSLPEDLTSKIQAAP